jgi:hypothetical protein
MSVTRSINFNDTTVIITLSNTTNVDNNIDWSIKLICGENKISTSGFLTTLVPTGSSGVTKTAIPVEPVKSDTDHVTVIKAILNECDETIGKENKAKVAIRLLTYITNEGLDFTNSQQRFKNAVIRKCYEFKQVNADMPDVVQKANQTLTVLGASTTIPADFKVSDMSIAAVPATVPKPAEKEDAPTMDLALFTVIAKKYNNKNVMANLKQYLGYFENAVRCNAHFTKGSTKAEKMTNYLNNLSDDGQRIALMKKIFEKHNLVFNDVAMDLYSDWVNTYNPTGKTNRYIKMNEFATIHKSLFTA